MLNNPQSTPYQNRSQMVELNVILNLSETSHKILIQQHTMSH